MAKFAIGDQVTAKPDARVVPGIPFPPAGQVMTIGDVMNEGTLRKLLAYECHWLEGAEDCYRLFAEHELEPYPIALG